VRSYQEEYIANVKEFISLNLRPGPEDKTVERYAGRMLAQCSRRRQLAERNMQLLREKLLPTLDHLAETDQEERKVLQEFSIKLLYNPRQVDVGLLCQIQQALVALARQEGDQSALIEHLYWLGLGRFGLSSKLVNMDGVAPIYYARVRECFQEVSTYLEKFDQIEDETTRSYIIRSIGNRALGQFPTVGERTRRLKEALSIMEDPHYRAMAPELPWDQYVKMVHQLMVSSISHSKERAMTGKDVADIMRSVYTVYRNTAPSPQQNFHRSAIEYYCGIQSLDHFLQHLRTLIDAADSRDFSQAGSYALISLPAYYCHYLSQYPERIEERDRFYVAMLYRRIQSYLDAVPPEQEDEHLFYYLRQLICTYVELEQCIPYRDFLYRLILHFAPGIYIHSRSVAETAKVLCSALLDRELSFFDDIPFLRDITDPDEKRKTVLDYAEGCGLFHDAGKINCLEVHTRTARRWSPVEDEMAQLHAISGYNMLVERNSTKSYAVAALGHHAWYDGNTMLGYPASYHRGEHPERRMVDVIALADWLVDGLNEYQLGPESFRSLEEAVAHSEALSGRRFSPKVAVLLKERPVQIALRQAMRVAFQEGCREIYQSSVK